MRIFQLYIQLFYSSCVAIKEFSIVTNPRQIITNDYNSNRNYPPLFPFWCLEDPWHIYPFSTPKKIWILPCSRIGNDERWCEHARPRGICGPSGTRYTCHVKIPQESEGGGLTIRWSIVIRKNEKKKRRNQVFSNLSYLPPLSSDRNEKGARVWNRNGKHGSLEKASL